MHRLPPQLQPARWYGFTATEKALGMQALQKVKESLGDLSASNIGNVLAIGLVQTKDESSS